MSPNKIQNIYVCSNCDAQSYKWNGRCLECGSWGTLQMQTVDQKKIEAEKLKISPAEVIDLKKLKKDDSNRIKTYISEVDRVLGGGIMPGSLTLLSGEPGIGKSTIVAQIANAAPAPRPTSPASELAGGRANPPAATRTVGQASPTSSNSADKHSSQERENNSSLSRRKEREGGYVLYASGEESATQIKARFDRLKCLNNNVQFISETNVEKIMATVEEIKPSLLIIDSIQAVYTGAVDSEAGSISQIRASAVNFLEMAKKKNIAVILIGHITKDGAIAGPKSLEHIVDTVIYLETDNKQEFRILRATKNRFGSINELGIFEMTGAGFKEIKNPGSIFLETSEEKISGSVISCIIEGTRPFLVEIQALATKTVFGYPQRKASGFDLNRLQILVAVLTKRAKINLTNQDVILNVVGGLKINDPGLDLAICLSITSSLLNQTVDRKTIVLGEVGLGGEIRNIAKLEQRLKEAEKLGFTKAIIPNTKIKEGKIKLEKVKNLNDIVKNF